MAKIIFYFFFYIIFAISLKKLNLKTIYNLSYFSEIHIVVKGSGERKLLYDNFDIEPFEVLVNDIKDDSCKKTCNLPKEINNVTLRFNREINSCYRMFNNLINIIEIDLSNFDFSKVANMYEMFGDCKNLTKINFGKIQTSSLLNMEFVFTHCYKLTSIDLSNFDTSKVKSMYALFNGCHNLEKINLGKINTSSVENMRSLFNSCKKLISLDLSNFDTSKTTLMFKMFYYCKNLKFLDLSNFDTSNVDSIALMFEHCESLIYLNLKSFKIKNTVNITDVFKRISPYVKFCLEDSETKNYLFSGNNKESNCDDDCFKENIKIDIVNNSCIESCKNNGFNYEFNNICYYECPTGAYELECEGDDCIHSIKECFDITPEGYYFDKTTNKYKKCLDLDKYFITIFMNNTNITNQEQVLNNIRKILLNESNKINLNSNDCVLNYNNVSYTITSTKNQKNNENINVSTINLGKCEDKIKEKYNIGKNDNLYILKLDIKLDKIQKVEYEVYSPDSTNNLKLLNLSICENIKIDISIPIELSKEEIDKYNKSSNIYNDICYISTSETGTDKPLIDRQKEYKNINFSVCEENCDFVEYDFENKKAICSCLTKVKLPLISEIQVDKEKLFSNFKDINNIGNFKMLKCVYLLFDFSNSFKVASNYLIFILVILSLIAIFSFICYNERQIKKYIMKYSFIKKSDKIYENNTTKNMKNYNQRKSKVFKLNNKNNSLFKNKERYFNFSSNNKRLSNNSKNKFIIKNDEYKKNIPNKTKLITQKPKKAKFTINKKLKFNLKTNSIIKNKFNYYNDSEMNSLLRTQHILIFTFCQFRDYNSMQIKIYILFLTFGINYLISAMFYSDATMHKIYVEQGSFDFTYQLPQMIYSFLISTILSTLLNSLGLYEDNIITFKNEKNKVGKSKKAICNIRIKIILFFVVSYIIIFLLWIYLGCFNTVYKNTQKHLILDVVSSFVISFIEPIFVYLLPGVFRILSLKKNVNRPLLFKFSKLLQLL